LPQTPPTNARPALLDEPLDVKSRLQIQTFANKLKYFVNVPLLEKHKNKTTHHSIRYYYVC